VIPAVLIVFAVTLAGGGWATWAWACREPQTPPEEPPRLLLRLVRQLVNHRRPDTHTPHAGASYTFVRELKTMAAELRHVEAGASLDPDEQAYAADLDAYEAAVTAHWLDAAGRIGDALAAFTAGHGIELGDVRPHESLDVALLRLRVGILEPISRPADVGTAEWHVGDLRDLLDAEDALAAVTR
jgi:hypothetical protein